MDKEKLIKSINSKGLHNSLISIYYNIGRALPFKAQRFPDGRVSDWYKSQYVEVVSVKPAGKGGKYGTAYGYYYRDGKKVDIEDNLCGEEIELNEISCAACGSWVLLDIMGEQTTEPAKIYGLNDVLEFGKYEGEILKTLIHNDWKWVKWAICESEHFFCDIDEVNEERAKTIRVMRPDDVLDFGKYRGKTIREIIDIDRNYILWLEANSDDFIIDCG